MAVAKKSGRQTTKKSSISETWYGTKKKTKKPSISETWYGVKKTTKKPSASNYSGKISKLPKGM